jgi:diguanylate cyclase (GGDEF)-like protein
MATAVSAVSAEDPAGVGWRAFMIVVAIAASLWLPWQALLPAALLIWFGPNYLRVLADDVTLFNRDMLLELPGILGLALFSGLARQALRRLEEGNLLLGATHEEFGAVDPHTGVYEERLMRPAIEAELARARRFNRQVALVLVGIDGMRQRFDYRDETAWVSSFNATANLLRSTRLHIDRVYRYGATGFALLLPESGEREVTGLVRRLRRVSRRAEPPEGEAGGPLPTHFGATFFPDCATTTDELLRRAEVALRLAEKSARRVQIDGAEAPDLPEPETLRRPEDEIAFPQASVSATSGNVRPINETIALAELGEGQQVDLPEPALVRTADLADSHLWPEGVVPSEGDLAAVREARLQEQPPGAQTTTTAVEQTVTPQPVLSLVQPTSSPVEQEAPTDRAGTAAVPPHLLSDAALLDESFDEVMKRMHETLAIIRSLRSGEAA